MLDQLPPVDKTDPLPRHAQVQRILRDMVASGKLQPGDKIPAEVDIAEKLGVSKMTVNKALLALTASGIFIREVGRGTFVADRRNGASPRREAPGTSRIVLSFVEGASNVLESDYYGTLYRGVMSHLEPHLSVPDATLSFALSSLGALDYGAEDARDPADGRLIIAPRVDSVPSIEALWNTGKSVLVIGASWPSMGVPSVDSDNIGGAAEAVQHLIRLGHRRIAMLLAEEYTANVQDRVVGYRRALDIARIPWNPEYEVRASEPWQTGQASHNRLADLLTGPHPVTAVFAAGHYLALEAKNIIRGAGLRIPEDVSVVGYDDPVSAQLVYPPLTTVRQPLIEMGRRAAERLLRFVNGSEPRTVVREMLPAQLIVRRSTAPARE